MNGPITAIHIGLKLVDPGTHLFGDHQGLDGADDETLVNALAMMCPFSTQEKQALLEAPDFLMRLQSLEALMQFVVAAPAGGGGDLQ